MNGPEISFLICKNLQADTLSVFHRQKKFCQVLFSASGFPVLSDRLEPSGISVLTEIAEMPELPVAAGVSVGSARSVKTEMVERTERIGVSVCRGGWRARLAHKGRGCQGSSAVNRTLTQDVRRARGG